MGYKAEFTKSTDDQGADLLIEKMGDRTVVQAKRYNVNVGNSAVQEVVSSKAFYKGCDSKKRNTKIYKINKY